VVATTSSSRATPPPACTPAPSSRAGSAAERLDGFRQEHSHVVDGKPLALPSYPHPRLMSDFWEFPTVSMGLGPMNAIYQAQFDKYLHNRGLKDTSQQHTWAFLGDGEMDEVESRGALQWAATEELDNLTFVVNCNLQRLDGPVRGNGKIIQELEAYFRGAGWNVIKVVWGRGWDPLLAADGDGALVHLMNATSDGDYQTFRANDGKYVRDFFFARDPRTRRMVENWSDEDVWWKLKRGGHDYHKVYAAYKAATEHTGQPTVILAKTIKGYGLGTSFAGRNATHQMKKLTLADLKSFRDSLKIPISDEVLEANPYLPPYYNPGAEDEAVAYALERRGKLGGGLPSRRTTHIPLHLPDDSAYAQVKKGSGKQNVATTMAFVRLLKDLMRDKEFGPRIVPIIPDEARTFGMDSFFPTIKIYNPHGQRYTSVDADLMLAYKESKEGQILHLGINEAGSTAAFTAVGTSYATHETPMIPIYIFYSMFGFQRTADSIWAAADQMTRGFLIGATAGRTTLTGEGLQHADGHSHLLAATNPAVRAYDPAFAYEIAHIMQDGLHRMYGGGDFTPDERNVIYYLTVYNEPMPQPAEPADVDREGILRGMYLYAPAITDGLPGDAPRVQLLASGVGMPWALEAQELLRDDWGVAADVWSVTSWNELRRDGLACDQQAYLHPDAEQRVPWVTQKLQGTQGPVVAVSDWMRAVQDQICPSANASASPSPVVSTRPWRSPGCARRVRSPTPTPPTSASTTSPTSLRFPAAPPPTAPRSRACRLHGRAGQRGPGRAAVRRLPHPHRGRQALLQHHPARAAPSPARCWCARCARTTSTSGATAPPTRATTSSGSTATACWPTRQLRIYKPWLDEDFVGELGGRDEMSQWLTERNLPYRDSQEKAYSTDANIWGATHEAKTLEYLGTSAWRSSSPIMGVAFWPDDVEIAPEDVSVRLRAGRPGRDQRQTFASTSRAGPRGQHDRRTPRPGHERPDREPDHRGQEPRHLRGPRDGAAAHRLRAARQRDPQRGHGRQLPQRGPQARPAAVRGPLARPAVLMLRESLQRWVASAITGEVTLRLRRGWDYTILDTTGPNAVLPPREALDGARRGRRLRPGRPDRPAHHAQPRHRRHPLLCGLAFGGWYWSWIFFMIPGVLYRWFHANDEN
jgi:pyruvate dehydrogenase E1 component